MAWAFPGMDSELDTQVARGFWERMVGLAWARSPRAAALLIPRCRSVHTFGMRFPLDLVFLDAEERVVEIRRDVPAWRIVRASEASAVLEIPSPN